MIIRKKYIYKKKNKGKKENVPQRWSSIFAENAKEKKRRQSKIGGNKIKGKKKEKRKVEIAI